MSLRVRTTAALAFVMVGLAPVAQAQIEEGRIPLQTAMSELSLFRDAYAESWNRKDLAAITAMYDTAAVLILGNGAVARGRAAISAALSTDNAWNHMVIESDGVRVYGNTAIDTGLLKTHPNGAPEVVSRYLVVLRRGYTDWRLVHASNTPVVK